MAEGDKAIEGTDRSSLRILVPWASQSTRKRGSGTGKKSEREMSGGRYLVADRNWRFHDTPLPGATELKAGSATRPFFGCNRRWSITKVTRWKALPKAAGDHRLLAGSGAYAVWRSRTFEQTYFSTFKNMYFSGDGARAMKMAITG